MVVCLWIFPEVNFGERWYRCRRGHSQMGQNTLAFSSEKGWDGVLTEVRKVLLRSMWAACVAALLSRRAAFQLSVSLTTDFFLTGRWNWIKSWCRCKCNRGQCCPGRCSVYIGVSEWLKSMFPLWPTLPPYQPVFPLQFDCWPDSKWAKGWHFQCKSSTFQISLVSVTMKFWMLMLLMRATRTMMRVWGFEERERGAVRPDFF